MFLTENGSYIDYYRKTIEINDKFLAELNKAFVEEASPETYFEINEKLFADFVKFNDETKYKPKKPADDGLMEWYNRCKDDGFYVADFVSDYINDCFSELPAEVYDSEGRDSYFEIK